MSNQTESQKNVLPPANRPSRKNLFDTDTEPEKIPELSFDKALKRFSSSTRLRAGASLDCGLIPSEFAKKHGQSEAEIWRQLRNGELSARSVQGKIVILEEDLTSEKTPHPDLPPLPIEDFTKSENLNMRSNSFIQTEDSGSEIALLVDHLSLAKEENREILRFTQEALRRMTQLSDDLISMKNTVIEAKDMQITQLKEEILTREKKLQDLMQINEDLEMLAKTLASQQT